MKSGADGADGDLQDGGDFVVGEFVAEAEFEGFADLPGEGGDGGAHGGEGGIFGGGRRGEVGEGGGGAGFSESGEAEVAGDAEEEGAGGIGVEALVAGAKGVDEGFLEEVFGVVTEGAAEVGEECRAVPVVKGFDFHISLHDDPSAYTSLQKGQKFIG